MAMMHTPDEICTMATAYKAKVQDGKIKRADWAHFCGLCGECLEDMQRAISGETSEQIDGKAWAAEGDRQRVVHALKVLSTFIRGEYSTSNAWNGAMSQKAMFNMRQNWDGQAASTEADRKAGGGEITVRLVAASKTRSSDRACACARTLNARNAARCPRVVECKESCTRSGAGVQ